MKQSSEKHFRCNVCQRGFTRIDHLKRHHLRHSGLKPYSCIFCNETFARCDNLRDHYPDCPQRGDRQIPETGQRGRRRHACESCMTMKLRCDGENPCSSCIKRNLTCNNERRNVQPGRTTTKKEPTSVKTEDYSEQSDRGSIKFLLNAGTDSFTEKFLLPPRFDRTRGMVYQNQKEMEEGSQSMLTTTTGASPNFFSGELDDQSFFQGDFMSFINGPFPDTQKSSQDIYGSGLLAPLLTPGPDPGLSVSGETAYFEPESAFSTALIQSILTKSWSVSLDAKSQQEISANLHFLLTTQRIRKFINLYFRYWHPNCQLIHPHSFDAERAPTPLLASVVFMGAMYSNDEREMTIARRLLDLAELFVFSTEPFSYEYEIGRVFAGRPTTTAEQKDWLHFQYFQAAYLMVVIQYWAGTKVSRNRAMETRFSEIIRVARSMGLTRCRHLPEDRIHEALWIQKECRIRTINIICSLDCAFGFFQNYPCRLTPMEMECDLPCEDSIFNSEHPFAQPNFRFNRELTVAEAFQSLFAEVPPAVPNYTVFDMFILIHLLYAYINTHMTNLIPTLQVQKAKPDPSQGQNSAMPEDSILATIRRALSRWRELWLPMRERIPPHEWASMGFAKNGYNFWLVAQLLITKKQSVDVIMKMEVKCEDKLEKLKVLLQDDNDDQT